MIKKSKPILAIKGHKMTNLLKEITLTHVLSHRYDLIGHYDNISYKILLRLELLYVHLVKGSPSYTNKTTVAINLVLYYLSQKLDP